MKTASLSESNDAVINVGKMMSGYSEIWINNFTRDCKPYNLPDKVSGID